MTAAVGNTAGETTLPPILAQAEQSISIGQTATIPAGQLKLDSHPPSVTITLDAVEAADSARFEGRVTPPDRTVIIRTVLANPVVVRLTALSLLNEIELKIETLGSQRSNSETSELHDLKRRVEEFLDAHAKGDEGPIADTALAISDDLRRLAMHENVRDIGLLGVGLSFCAAAGALGVSDPVILAVSAIAGGKRVADVLNATANLIWGKSKDDKKS